jgi:hypothetical protein
MKNEHISKYRDAILNQLSVRLWSFPHKVNSSGHRPAAQTSWWLVADKAQQPGMEPTGNQKRGGISQAHFTVNLSLTSGALCTESKKISNAIEHHIAS